MAKEPERIEVENVSHPGKVRAVDAAKYRATKRALLRILPRRSPGLTEAEFRGRVAAVVGDGGSWWAKLVQADLEAKGLVVRERTRPLRWRRP